MRAGSLVTLGAAGVAAIALTVGSAAGRAQPQAGRPVAAASAASAASSIVYEWGQFGGGQHRPPGLIDGIGGASTADVGSPDGVGPVHDAPIVVQGLPGDVAQIATSNSDSYALTRGGTVYAWGPGAQGELGDGVRTRFSPRAVRVDLPAGVRIASLPNPMPYDGGMAIATDGTVWAWGNNRSNDFCQPTHSLELSPIEVPLSDVTLAVGALRHTIYDAGGRIVSCGAGRMGQLGDGRRGAFAHANHPVAVRGLPDGGAVALTSGWGNAGVLMADGRYYDWGYNAGGQVGDGTRRDATTAVRVALPRPVTAVFEGGSYADNGQSVALLSGGELWEWGSGRFGQLGNGTNVGSTRPIRLTRPPGVSFVAVDSGGSTSYAISLNGGLWAWGNNLLGQLGAGSAQRESKVPIEDQVTVSQISSTAHNVAALALSATPLG